MVGTPRRRGPKLQARRRRLWDAKAARAAQVGGRRRAIPTLANERAAARLVRQHLVKNGRDAAPSGSQDSGAQTPFLGCRGGSRRASRTATARHPYLGGNERVAARLVRQHLVKKVGTPRGRGPIFAAEPPLFRIRTLLADGASRLRLGTTRSSSLHLERRGHPPISRRK